MMLNSFQVALVLTIIVYVFYAVFKKKIRSAKVYFCLLFLMTTAGLVYDVQQSFEFGESKLFNIVVFIILLLTTMIPWLKFDKWSLSKSQFQLTEYGVSTIRTVCNIVIVSSVFSILYVMPYAFKSFAIGAAEIRTYLADLKVLPESPLTTFAIGVGSISPLFITLFFLTMMDMRLKKFQNWIFLSCFTYIFTSMPFMARDGYVKLPIIFIVNYLVFKSSLDLDSYKKIKRYAVVLLSLSVGLISIYSFSRFFSNSPDKWDSLMSGTWGYLYQQPYVFDRTIEMQDNWHSVSLRFPILNQIFGIGSAFEVKRIYDFETMFGTMLSEFYSISGWDSLIISTLIYVSFYSFCLDRLMALKNTTGIVLMFMVYIMLQVSGLFYFMYGGTSLNYLIIVLSLAPLFLKKNIIILK